MTMNIVMIAVALILVVVNGFFVLSEFAIVKVRKTRLEELARQGLGSAKIAVKIVNRLDSYLSAIQLGITLASLALGWIGEPAVARLLAPLMVKIFGANDALIHTVSFIIAFSAITLLHVVLGELVPKSVAIHKSEKMSLMIAWPLYIFHKISYPFVYIFDKVAAFCLRIIGMQAGKEHEQAHTEEEIRMIVSASYNDGVLDDTEGQFIDNVFTFADKNARELMIPRTDMACLSLEDSYEDNLKLVLSSNYTRFPLCRTDKDNIIGMVHLRDLLENSTRETPEKDLEKLAREILFIPETLDVSALMQLIKKKRIHLAIVVDEYGGTAGLISLEDLLEEIVGDINDEYDELDTPDVVELSPSVYEINGLMEQGEVEKLLGIDLGDQDDETIAGYVFGMIGRKPKVGDMVAAHGFNFEVIAVDHLRIDRIKVYPIAE